jgi:hypothetical protein
MIINYLKQYPLKEIIYDMESKEKYDFAYQTFDSNDITYIVSFGQPSYAIYNRRGYIKTDDIKIRHRLLKGLDIEDWFGAEIIKLDMLNNCLEPNGGKVILLNDNYYFLGSWDLICLEKDDLLEKARALDVYELTEHFLNNKFERCTGFGVYVDLY